MSSIPPWVARVPVLRRFAPTRQERAVELFRFGTVGGMNWVVDLAVFNLARWLLPAGWVLLAKIIAVAVAASFSWLMNRSWTFRKRATENLGREFSSFLVINVIGLTPPLICLWISHHLLGLTTALADNISANVIGLALGTILRYLGYRHLVFTRTEAPDVQAPEV